MKSFQMKKEFLFLKSGMEGAVPKAIFLILPWNKLLFFLWEKNKKYFFYKFSFCDMSYLYSWEMWEEAYPYNDNFIIFYFFTLLSLSKNLFLIYI